MSIRLALAACAALTAAACASTPAAENTQTASADPNRLICTYERPTGSNRAERICITAAQRDEARAAARDANDRIRDASTRGTVDNGAGGG